MDFTSLCAHSNASLTNSIELIELRVRNEFSTHAQKVGPGLRSRFLVLIRRSVASGDANGLGT